MTEGEGGTPSVKTTEWGLDINPPDLDFNQILNDNGSPLVSKIRQVYFHHVDGYHDLDLALQLYKFYKDHKDYIILYNLEKEEYTAIKSAKRGNDVYLYRIRQRLNPILHNLKHNNVIFADNDRHKIYTTHFLFVNLTFDCLPIETYEKASGIKEFMDLLRKIFGKVYVVAWGLDLQSSGKLHYDAVIYVPSGVHVRWWFSQNRKKPILVLVNQQLFEDIKSKWKYGYVNIEGVSSLKDAISYCLKYVLSSAQNELLNCVALLYRKRTFYIAKYGLFNQIFDRFKVPLRLDSNMNNCDHNFIFVGLYPYWLWDIDPSKWYIKFKAPPPEECLGVL